MAAEVRHAAGRQALKAVPGLSPNLRRVRTISRGTSLGRRVPREHTLPGDLSRDSPEGREVLYHLFSYPQGREPGRAKLL